ncbi:MAG: hypothetical protein KDI55_16710 [Anaerolineae bacterium]|nr:hypothetical protein [Anaerolineae bacterium]
MAQDLPLATPAPLVEVDVAVLETMGSWMKWSKTRSSGTPSWDRSAANSSSEFTFVVFPEFSSIRCSSAAESAGTPTDETTRVEGVTSNGGTDRLESVEHPNKTVANHATPAITQQQRRFKRIDLNPARPGQPRRKLRQASAETPTNFSQ